MIDLTRTADFDPVPSVKRSSALTIGASAAVPASASAVGVPVGAAGAVPASLGLDRAALTSAGFKGEVGQTLLVPSATGPSLIAVGIGEPAGLDAAKLRDAAAEFARAAGRHARLATTLADAASVSPELAAQAVVEGVLLARYCYDGWKASADTTDLADLTLVGASDRLDALTRGAERGKITAAAAQLARDLANTPHAYLTATRLGELAEALAADRGLGVEVFGPEELAAMGCGGILGVNAGSAEPPRMIKLTYQPRGASGASSQPTGHLAMVGKGVMYDSGGLSLKPSDPMHANMKMDMSGAAAVLASMSALAALDCPTRVTGYLMCTDNMPSGTATALGDVLHIRGGKTVEVVNTDAEGRLILADGLVLATEQHPDAIVNIATLTGACMRALGEAMSGVFGNNQAFVDQVSAAAERTDEAVWQLPLERRYRKLFDSDIADMKNLGGENGGAIVAALFLAEFVGDTPWAHLDICGPMQVNADESWRTKGATGYGTRLLLDLALNFTPPAAGKEA